LLVAGALKVGNLQKSAMAVRAYELLPTAIANFLGYVLPWLEIGLGLLLILGVAVSISGLFGAIIMFAFIIAIAQAWARGLSIDCGCFGGGGPIDPSQTKYFVALGRSIGINSNNFEQCVNDGKYVNWTGNVAAASAKADVNGTPTIKINGKALDRNTEYGDLGKFRAALAAGGVK